MPGWTLAVSQVVKPTPAGNRTRVTGGQSNAGILTSILRKSASWPAIPPGALRMANISSRWDSGPFYPCVCAALPPFWCAPLCQSGHLFAACPFVPCGRPASVLLLRGLPRFNHRNLLCTLRYRPFPTPLLEPLAPLACVSDYLRSGSALALSLFAQTSPAGNRTRATSDAQAEKAGILTSILRKILYGCRFCTGT